MKKGFVNISIDLETNKVFVSNKPYETKEDAESAMFIGGSIYIVGTFEIEYPLIKSDALNFSGAS